MSEITAFIGVLIIATKDWNTPENAFLTPSHAFFQFPVNTPVIKSNTPPSVVMIPPNTPEIRSPNAETYFPATENTNSNTGCIFVIIPVILPTFSITIFATTGNTALKHVPNF